MATDTKSKVDRALLDRYLESDGQPPWRDFKAARNACDAIGATTEALEAGVLQEMRDALEIIACACEDYANDEWTPEHFAGNINHIRTQARAVLAKLTETKP